MTNQIMDYFNGSMHGQIDEDVVDEVIEVLSIKSDEVIWHSPFYEFYQKTTKECLWDDLAIAIYSSGKASATEQGTSPFILKEHLEALETKISKATEALKSMEYEALFKKGLQTREFIAAKIIRGKSKAMNPRIAKKYRNVAPSYIQQEYERTGKCGKYCPFDDDLPTTVATLETISSYVVSALEDLKETMKGRGVKKPAKDNSDALFWQLCLIYKKYTRKHPTFWLKDGDFTGDIILFLQVILPHTSYKGKTTPSALQKKFSRMTKDPEFKGLREGQ